MLTVPPAAAQDGEGLLPEEDEQVTPPSDCNALLLLRCQAVWSHGSSTHRPHLPIPSLPLPPPSLLLQVPGTYMDAMSGNTPLGKAIRGACEELDTLGSLERDTLNEAEALLKSVGYKGSLFTPPPSEGDDDV